MGAPASLFLARRGRRPYTFTEILVLTVVIAMLAVIVFPMMMAEPVAEGWTTMRSMYFRHSTRLPMPTRHSKGIRFTDLRSGWFYGPMAERFRGRMDLSRFAPPGMPMHMAVLAQERYFHERFLHRHFLSRPEK